VARLDSSGNESLSVLFDPNMADRANTEDALFLQRCHRFIDALLSPTAHNHCKL
jgi:hypothetical protein